MAITSEIIGKLGGADVEEHPIGLEAVKGTGVRHPLLTVNVSGRTLVTIVAEITAGPSTSSNQPQFYFGDILGPRMSVGEVRWAEIVDTDTEIGLQTNVAVGSGSQVTFSGSAYVTPLE